MGSQFQSLIKNSPRPLRRKRTFNLWVLILGFLVLSIYGWARLIYSWQNAYWLNFAQVYPGYIYLEVTGTLWGLVGLVAGVWTYLQRGGYRLAGAVAALLLAFLYWGDRILFYRDGSTGPNTLFAVIMTFLLLAYTGLVLRPLGDMHITPARIEKRGSDVEIRARD